jgi:hypothetical protein
MPRRGASKPGKEVFSINLRTKLRQILGIGRVTIGSILGDFPWGEAWTRYDWVEVQAAEVHPPTQGWNELALSSYDKGVKDVSVRSAFKSVQPKRRGKPSHEHCRQRR